MLRKSFFKVLAIGLAMAVAGWSGAAAAQTTTCGITGSASADSTAVGEAVARIKRHTKLPVCVGFGIRTPDAAREIAESSNGAVVGTALVDALKGSLDADGHATDRTVTAVADLVAALAQGVRGAKQAAE